MKVTTFIPAPQLLPFVQKFLTIECAQEQVNRLLPGQGAVLSMRLRGKVTADGGAEIPGVSLNGLWRSVRTVRYEANSAMLLVIFQPGGAAPFFRERMDVFSGSYIPLENVLPANIVRALANRIQEALGLQEKVRLVESFLIHSLHEQRNYDPYITGSIERILRASGVIKVRHLLQGMPVSRDTFEKRFRAIVGLAPAQFARTVRLNHLTSNHGNTGSLTDLAHSGGYYDQSHFIKDFRAFSGLTPTDFFRTQKQW